MTTLTVPLGQTLPTRHLIPTSALVGRGSGGDATRTPSIGFQGWDPPHLVTLPPCVSRSRSPDIRPGCARASGKRHPVPVGEPGGAAVAPCFPRELPPSSKAGKEVTRRQRGRRAVGLASPSGFVTGVAFPTAPPGAWPPVPPGPPRTPATALSPGSSLSGNHLPPAGDHVSGHTPQPPTCQDGSQPFYLAPQGSPPLLAHPVPTVPSSKGRCEVKELHVRSPRAAPGAKLTPKCYLGGLVVDVTTTTTTTTYVVIQARRLGGVRLVLHE